MQTCIVKGFVDIPATKYYYYHGLIKPCNIQPNPECFLKIDTEEGQLYWDPIYEVWPVKTGEYTLYYEATDFLASDETDPCRYDWPDEKARYYYFEIEYYNGSPGEGWYILLNNGKYCNFQVDSGFDDYHYRAMYRWVWYSPNFLLKVKNPGEGTRIKVWRSSTGLLPDYWPVPKV